MSRDLFPKTNLFLDNIIDLHNLKNDAGLCAFLGVHPPVISKTRSGVLKVGSSLILRLHEKMGLPVAGIRSATDESK